MIGKAFFDQRWACLKRSTREPLVWIVVAAGVFHVVGLGWGLPASDGWDNDGVAPRDFLAGIVQTFWPGQFYTYPPVHLALLTVLTLPITVVALARAPSLSRPDVIGEILKVPYMTAMAGIARMVSVAMSLGIVVIVARIAAELRASELGVAPTDPRAERAGLCAAALVGVNFTLNYYAHTTNLDVPYTFWGAAAILALVRAMTRREPRRVRHALILATLAVGTKDQAYAMFILSVPVAIAAWLTLDRWARREARAVLREVAIAVALAVALLLVIDAVIVNPTGFRARVAFLTGSASRDFVHYGTDWNARWVILHDLFIWTPRYYPWLLAPVIPLGLLLVVARARAVPPDRRGAHRVASLFPLFVAISFTIAFNWVARRTDHRFLLPQFLAFSVYGGLGVEAIAFATGWRRIVGQAVLSVGFAQALFACAAIDWALLYDPRYQAERWLAANVRPGDTIEVHGLNVYLPRFRFPPDVRVIRVEPTPVDTRNPMPGFVEVRDTYGRAHARGARFLVLSSAFAGRYLLDVNMSLEAGRVLPPTQIVSGADPDGSSFFQGLVRGQQGFRWAHHARCESKLWPIVDIHASTCKDIWIFERVPAP